MTGHTEATKLSVVLPITNSVEFDRRIGFAIPIPSKMTEVVRCDQPDRMAPGRQ